MIGKRKIGRYQELLSSFRNNMGKLQMLAKKYLDSDIKLLVKHKLLDNTLNPTEEGLEFLAAFLFSKYKAELAQELKTQKKEEDDEDESEEKEVKAKKK